MSIAASCTRPALAKLIYNRAHLYELMTEFNDLNQALSADSTSRTYYQAYRIFIGLAEAFAVKAIAEGDSVALNRLNRTYQEYIAITELRLKGYDLIADRLERELQF